MKRVLSVIGGVVAVLLSAIFAYTAVSVAIDIPKLFMPSTAVIPIISAIVIAATFLCAAIYFFKNEKSKKAGNVILALVLISVVIFSSARVINGALLSSWEHDLKLEYLGEKTLYISGSSNPEFRLTNTTNKTLHNVRLLVKCSGWSEDGRTALSWSTQCDAADSIGPNASIDVTVYRSSAEQDAPERFASCDELEIKSISFK